MLNLTLKFWVESKPLDIVELYESVFLLRERVSFSLHLFVSTSNRMVSSGINDKFDEC